MVFTNAKIVTLKTDDDFGVIECGAIALDGPRIAWVGPAADLPDQYKEAQPHDLGGRLVTSGLIDCHTHVVFGGNRATEFELRLNGASYEEVAKAGGGIVSTVKATRQGSEVSLLADALTRVDAMIAEGVTLIEVKSGYGLDREAELKMLRVARQIAKARPIDLRTSFLGAHAVPAEYSGRPDAYIDDVCIPALRDAHSEGLVDAVDGFCEGIAFNTEQIARVFDVAKELGLPVKLHAEQLSNIGGTQLAARYAALSADHVEYARDEDARALSAAGTVAVILPGAFYTLRETQAPPIQAFRDNGVRMALATDCNPGSSPLTSALLTMNMACTLFRMTPLEALMGMTVNAAHALGETNRGRVVAGAVADLCVWNVDHAAELAYRMGFNPLHTRIFRGGTMTVILTPGSATLAQLQDIWAANKPAALHASSHAGIQAAADLVAEAASSTNAIYGINTGFGKLASVKIAAEDVATLQRNLILSHCCGVGDALDEAAARLMMVLKLLSLGRGASGVAMSTVSMIEAMLKEGVIPVIPSQGSVGASGDLAPLAHMAAAMIGEGEATYKATRMPAGDALAKAGLTPIILGAKEGLALINGTQFSTACALVGLWGALRNAATTIVTCALSTDAIMGSTAPLQESIHALRGHAGQIAVARAQRALMEGSEIRESHRDGDTRVQDPYCIRCQPQVTGAAMDLLHFAGRTLEIEANAVTDNPLVLVENDLIVSGGNFHAEPVGFAADQIAIAISEIGAISQRRIALMVDPTLSFDLPPFLTPDPGLNSGLMIAEVTTAALMSENKHLANPCTTDSTPTSANQEDHVSMAAHAARRLERMNANLSVIIGVEAMCGAQGIEFRAPLQTSPALRVAMGTLRNKVPAIAEDRYMAPSMEAAAKLVASGALAGAVELSEYVQGHAE